jgi:hypothetical protein
MQSTVCQQDGANRGGVEFCAMAQRRSLVFDGYDKTKPPLKGCYPTWSLPKGKDIARALKLDSSCHSLLDLMSLVNRSDQCDDQKFNAFGSMLMRARKWRILVAATYDGSYDFPWYASEFGTQLSRRSTS